PVNFNYHELDGTDVGSAQIDAAFLPAPFNIDAQGTPTWNHDLLAGDPAVPLEPKQVITYEINPKAIWYDGTPITWEDFHWQWRASNGTNPPYQISFSQGYQGIENVARGRDDREVVVTFKNRYADWPNLFAPFYPASTN